VKGQRRFDQQEPRWARLRLQAAPPLDTASCCDAGGPCSFRGNCQLGQIRDINLASRSGSRECGWQLSPNA
jgi:hypothetical protein